MKKILLMIVMFLMFAGIVNAASINGDFEGNAIVKIKSNGKDLKVQDVPAVLYHDRTMVPIYLLEQLGVKLDWDGKTYSVNVTMPHVEPKPEKPSFADLANSLKSNGVTYVQYVTDGSMFREIQFTYSKNTSDANNVGDLDAMFKNSLLVDANSVRIYNADNTQLMVLTSYVRSFYNGLITSKELADHYVVTDAYGKTVSNTASNQTTTNTTSSNNHSIIVYPLLYSNDGKTYLGKLTSNEFDTESIFNEFGDYGSEFSSTSIWNEFSNYGGSVSTESAFNDLALKPPIIVLNGKIIGHLTTNETITDGISPYGLEKWLEDNGY